MDFVAEPAADSATAWRGHGRARLAVSAAGAGWRVAETGRFWPQAAVRGLSFSNCYRWEPSATAVALHHERFGHRHPVHLLSLVADGPDALVSAQAHVCGADRYRARIALCENGFDLYWQITGPAKHEALCYRYRGPAL